MFSITRLPPPPAGLSPSSFKGKNVVLFMTDQERSVQHFPAGWEAANLPGMTRLKANGLSFKRAGTNACMCSPARATLFSGFFPAQHGVRYTLEAGMPDSKYPQIELPLPADLPNLATVMTAAGFNSVYKGKFHLDKAAAADGTWAQQDVGKYGFSRWNPADAGANQSLSEAGGNPALNDQRYMTSTGAAGSENEGVLQFIGSSAAQAQPFFLIVSLVRRRPPPAPAVLAPPPPPISCWRPASGRPPHTACAARLRRSTRTTCCSTPATSTPLATTPPC
jgi:arylsulfatase A-like enzyme